MFKSYKPATLLVALIVTGCSVGGEGLWPETAYRNGVPVDPATDAPHAAAPAPWAEPIALAEPLVLDLPAQQEVPENGTFVGRKVTALRSDLNLLIAMVTAQNDEFATIAIDVVRASRHTQLLAGGVRSGMSTGTASGDADVAAQLQMARAGLDRIAGNRARLTDLSMRVAGNASRASYVSAAANSAMTVDGATDADRQHLTTITDETAQVIAQNDRLLTEIRAAIARNDAAVTAGHADLDALAATVGQGGTFVANRSMASRHHGGAALFVVGFGRPEIEFEQALHDTVSATLDQRPGARFQLVAVEPQTGASGAELKRSAARVFKSLLGAGLPTDRVTLASETSNLITVGEVQIHAY